MKVLISAYACSPLQGSEAAVGWGFVINLSKHHDIWVIVEKNKFENDILNYCKKFPDSVKRIKFFFIEKRRNKLLRKLWPPSYYYYYRNWHKEAFILAQKLHNEVNFDICHQLTMVGFREPGYLWKLPTPFVWGPVGGMGYFPFKFLSVLDTRSQIYYLCYNFLNYIHMKFLTRPKLASKKSGDGLIIATSENRKFIAKYWGQKKTTLLSEVGTPPTSSSCPKKRGCSENLEIVWTGLHIPRKALNIGLFALSELPQTLNWHLTVVGSGQMTMSWVKLAEKLGISKRITFAGSVSRNVVLSIMQKGHLMLITSLRDLTSTVTIEALSQGLPIICLNHCGFADVVNNSCGIKVSVKSPSKTIKEISSALQILATDEKLRIQLSNGAITMSKHYDWSRKIELVNKIYFQKKAEPRIKN